nr:WAT1-related protein [Ipomoea batatas]
MFARSSEQMGSVVAMVVVQMLLGGDIVLCKVAADEGMPVSIIVAYRFIFSAAFLSPIAFILERGTLFNNIAKTSATLAAASGSIVDPAMTTVISVLLTTVISVLQSVLGGIVIIAGIYGVLWAKERDMKQVSGAICDIEMAGE